METNQPSESSSYMLFLNSTPKSTAASEFIKDVGLTVTRAYLSGNENLPRLERRNGRDVEESYIGLDAIINQFPKTTLRPELAELAQMQSPRSTRMVIAETNLPPNPVS